MATLTSEIITDAFRQSNLLAIGVEPTELQSTEALRYLNRLVKSVFGNEAGDPFTPFPIGRNGISRPQGWPYWNNTPGNYWWVPLNVRIMLNLESPVELWLSPQPDDGARFAVIDVAQTVADFPVPVHGNGRRIDGATEILLDENGVDKEWFYRADLGNWVIYAPLFLDTMFPFPIEFDDFFITMLALRLNPSYGAQLDPQSNVILSRSRSQLRSRYTQVIPVRSELGLIRTPKMSADRDEWGNGYWEGNPDAMFDSGYPFIWQ